MKTLDLLKTGNKGVIKDLAGGLSFLSRASSTGFTPGTEVTMVQNFKRGPLIVYLRDTHIALGRSEAKKIQIQNKRL